MDEILLVVPNLESLDAEAGRRQSLHEDGNQVPSIAFMWVVLHDCCNLGDIWPLVMLIVFTVFVSFLHFAEIVVVCGRWPGLCMPMTSADTQLLISKWNGVFPTE